MVSAVVGDRLVGRSWKWFGAAARTDGTGSREQARRAHRGRAEAPCRPVDGTVGLRPAVLALAQLLALRRAPESPLWLLGHGQSLQATEELAALRALRVRRPRPAGPLGEQV